MAGLDRAVLNHSVGAEREECAQVADRVANEHSPALTDYERGWLEGAEAVAKLLRERTAR